MLGRSVAFAKPKGRALAENKFGLDVLLRLARRWLPRRGSVGTRRKDREVACRTARYKILYGST